MKNIEPLKFSILQNLGQIYNDLEDETSIQSFYDLSLQMAAQMLLQSTIHCATLKNVTITEVQKEWENYTSNLYRLGLNTLNSLLSAEELN